MARFIDIELFYFREQKSEKEMWDDECEEENDLEKIIYKTNTILNVDHIIRIDKVYTSRKHLYRELPSHDYYELTLSTIGSSLESDHRTYLASVFSNTINITIEEFNKWFKDSVERKK